MDEAGRVATAKVGSARARWLARAAALALPVVSAVELGGEACVAASVPDDDAWDAVAREVRSLAHGGAPVVASPRWIEPHLRQRLGDDAMPLAHVARPDVGRFASAVEVSLGGPRGGIL